MGLIGGSLKKNMTALIPTTNHLYLMIILLIFLLIKMIFVKYCYNQIVPKLMKDDNVYKLTYVDSLLLVILASCLF
jgi:MFS-type transporter involved in bile tolerance (Atg22 family)